MAGARVPLYDNTPVAPSNAPNVQAQPPASEYRMADALGQHAKEEAGLAKAIGDVGTVGSDIDLKMQAQADQVRVQDALNQARTQANTLAYDPQQGYLSKVGKAALDGVDGKPLSQVYGDKLSDSIGDISSSLGNDNQRRMFQEHAGQLESSFQEGIMKHTSEQFKTYQGSVADGALKLATDQAGLQWNNPPGVDNAVDQAKTAVYQKGIATGASGNAVTAAQQAAESTIRKGVIEAAIDNNNPSYAMQYFNKYKGDGTGAFGGLNPDDILSVQGKLNAKMDAHIAGSAVQDTMSENQKAFAPTNIDRLSGIVQGMESNNQRYGPDGKTLLTSGEGAKGEMQVQDNTNKDPGFGVTPAKDDSPDERARVGRDYLTAMVQRYGGADKALAAYNAGPGTLDDAMQQAKMDGKPAEWLSYMPNQTQAYVANGVKQFNAGGGVTPMPTKLDFVNAALQKLGPDPRPEVVTNTRELAEKNYELVLSSKKEQGDAALKSAQQELIANGGNFSQLSSGAMSNLTQYDPENYEKAQKFATAISNPTRPTNDQAYATAVAHPDEMAKMSDAQWTQFGMTNLSDPDFKALSKMRADQMTGKATDAPDNVNTKAITSALNERLRSTGMDDVADQKSDDAKSQYGATQKFIRDYLEQQQQQIGRKFTPAEVEEQVGDLFAKQVVTPGTIYGTNTQPLMAMTVNDIPSKTMDRIKSFYTSKGISNPTRNDVLNLYRQLEMKRGR